MFRGAKAKGKKKGNVVITKEDQMLFLPFQDQMKAQEQLCESELSSQAS